MAGVAAEQVVFCHRCGAPKVISYWDTELESYIYIVPRNSFAVISCDECNCRLLVNRMRNGKYSFYKFYIHKSA